jgi:hypothetical protein
MAQAIKYETTSIAAEKSAGEIAALVAKYGASRFEQQWNERGELCAIRFALRTELGEVPVRMDARTERIMEMLRRPTWTLAERRQQALRIAWRHLKDLTEQLLLAVHLGLKDVGAAFMDSVEVIDPGTGETVTMRELLASHAHQISAGRPLRLLPAAVHAA